MRQRRNILVPALVAVLVAGALVGTLWLRDSMNRGRGGAGTDNTLADGQPNDRSRPDIRNGADNSGNMEQQPGRQQGNRPGNPKGNRPGNQPANPSSEPEQPDELRLPEVPGIPKLTAVPNPTPVLPELSWDPDAPFGVRSGDVITKPVLDIAFHHGMLPSDNMLAIWLRGVDFAPGQTSHPIRAEIINSAGRLLVDGIWHGGEGSKSGDDPAFLLPYPEDDWFVVRLTKAGRVGIATFGTTPFTMFSDYANTAGTSVSRGRRFRITLHVDIQDHLRAREAVRVLDRDGAPLAGAVLSCGHSVLGQSGEDGVIRFAPPVPGEVQQHVYDAWQRSILRVSRPGKVPAFIKASDLKPGETLTVTLPADEIVLSFYLLHAGFEDPQRWEQRTEPISRIEGGRYFSVLPYWRKDWNLESYMRVRSWRSSGFHMATDPLKDVLGGRPIVNTIGYEWWYQNKWSYAPATGMWTVVLPFTGMFVYIMEHEKRMFTNIQGKSEEGHVMSPGLYVDARDPANPKAQFIWPN